MEFHKVYLDEIKALLDGEFEAFLESYSQERLYGLRINRLKISVDDFLAISPFKLTPIPWTVDGFYYEGTERPSKHPYYHAGLYYLQEPSAMAPVSALDPVPGDMVLDLCACPGGKTLQIASALGGKGTIVANDISASRIKALIHNLEISGVTNALVLNEDGEKLGARFKAVFDRVLLDAPCSGEGMFRKDNKTFNAWSPEKPKQYRDIQEGLLVQAAGMLKPGGRLAYSTCTFNRLENEWALQAFLETHAEFRRRLPEAWMGLDTRTGDGRLWPHLHMGEGHFISVVEREASSDADRRSFDVPQASEVPPEAYRQFEAENLRTRLEGHFLFHQGKLYKLPEGLPSLKGLRVVRSGWFLGEVKNGRFVPSGALAMGLRPSEVRRVIRLEPDQFEVIRYLKGETLSLEGEEGLNLICTGDFPLGWGKLSGGILKNQYPAGWRML